MEKILKIDEATFDRFFDGYQITTNKQIIKLGISNGQSCCEEWGYFMSEDNFDRFIGSELLGVEIVDNCLSVKKVEHVYKGSTMFVNIKTSVGLLQFTAYNDHNGYYGHDAVVISEQLKYEETL